ncbi:MAG: 3-hydroxyacyl-[acyl-carrier-protein] dehydratase FabZ [Elusimicrobia bacterium HGW-Elusimicrobia-4]|nr:MAG: 3-hydroxyacyl-[acyl-carrier-protein] dehydratase FabZ [Elusimicrobia bacterium HGW-Elusimicrobia-4]
MTPEMKRKISHWFILLVPFFYIFFLEKETVLIILAIAMSVVIIFELLRLKNEKLNQKLLKIFNGIYRETEAKNVSTLIFTLSGIFFTVLFFEKEIAPARTFCFDYEIEALKNKGLAKGGSLENAIVIGAKKILTSLRFEDEFVRHKILDLIGDISLLGSPLKMEITAVKCGHKNNIEFAKKIASSENTAQRAEPEKLLWQIPDGKIIDINEIKATIPHRFPFLFIDKVILVEEVKRAVGIKNVSAGEPFFQGHFPEQAIMPGVLIIEALAQTACVLLLSKPELKSKKLAYFMSINNVKFRRPVFPGDTLYLDIEVLKAKQTTGIIRGCAFVDGKPTTEAEFTFVLVDKP